MDTEVRSVTESLANHLSLILSLEVRSERLQVQLASLGHEEMGPAVAVLGVIGWSSFDLTGHILVIGRKSVAEL